MAAGRAISAFGIHWKTSLVFINGYSERFQEAITAKQKIYRGIKYVRQFDKAFK